MKVPSRASLFARVRDKAIAADSPGFGINSGLFLIMLNADCTAVLTSSVCTLLSVSTPAGSISLVICLPYNLDISSTTLSMLSRTGAIRASSSCDGG